MQIRCQRCSGFVNVKNEEIEFALQALKESGDRHYTIRCPRCRQTNKVSLEQLEKAMPRPTGSVDEADAS